MEYDFQKLTVLRPQMGNKKAKNKDSLQQSNGTISRIRYFMTVDTSNCQLEAYLVSYYKCNSTKMLPTMQSENRERSDVRPPFFSGYVSAIRKARL